MPSNAEHDAINKKILAIAEKRIRVGLIVLSSPVGRLASLSALYATLTAFPADCLCDFYLRAYSTSYSYLSIGY